MSKTVTALLELTVVGLKGQFGGEGLLLLSERPEFSFQHPRRVSHSYLALQSEGVWCLSPTSLSFCARIHTHTFTCRHLCMIKIDKKQTFKIHFDVTDTLFQFIFLSVFALPDVYFPIDKPGHLRRHDLTH